MSKTIINKEIRQWIEEEEEEEEEEDRDNSKMVPTSVHDQREAPNKLF